ncbi:hypothetical protein [uncultured Alcanivorax sp.]|uniref:DUF7014 domain-containing protein n=1 Tax=uncultured Alcanivorax sp. TaxID=191215 RepID=UPI002605B162|nr:hypothetical protein [uncultured Alcanivorax sp.]
MFENLFNVFSRREAPVKKAERRPLTPEFRNRLIMLLQDQLRGYFADFLAKLQRQVAYLHGTLQLSSSGSNHIPQEDLLDFLLTCSDEHFLDAIELIFRSQLPGITWPDNDLIPIINQLFQVDDLPYHLTAYTTEEFESSFHGTPATEMRIAEYPCVIRKDSEIPHRTAMEPALNILAGAGFQHANKEFLEALEDHRKSDFGDCLTKCGSAFESVMKVICDKNSIGYKQTDTASVLLKTLLANAKLDGFWEQPLIMIATLRNRLSSSHGAGTQPKAVPEHVATYVVNATASAILLLCGEFS